MRKLEWNVQYSVGVPKLDRQHAYLFELAQRLVKHIDEKEILEKTIAELYRYVEQHFAYEESVMEKAHYDDVESHRKAHALMRTRLDLLAGQLRQGVLHRGELRPVLRLLRRHAHELLQDLLDALGREGLQVHIVRRDRIGHDGGGVAVDQRYLDAFVAEGAAGLGAAVIEFAGLADDDRSTADEQDRLDAFVLGHSGGVSGPRRYLVGGVQAGDRG